MAYFTTLYSGSSGNCALIRSDDKYLLIDMGKSCRTTLTALKSLGLAVSDCVGILVTHEHSDHVSGLDTFLKKHLVPLYGCADTLDTLASRGTIPPAVEAIPVDGQTLEIGSFTVTSFPTSHDVPCCGYRIRTPEGRVMAFATDLGYLTPVVQDNLMGCDLVALEANYDAFSLHLAGTFSSASRGLCQAKLAFSISTTAGSAAGAGGAGGCSVSSGRGSTRMASGARCSP